MVTVGKYTVRPMDPMAHVSLVRFGCIYSTFLCVAFLRRNRNSLGKTNQLQKRHYHNPTKSTQNGALVLTRISPLFFLGGGLHLQTYTFKIFSGHWGSRSRYIILTSNSRTDVFVGKIFIQVSPASTPPTGKQKIQKSPHAFAGS